MTCLKSKVALARDCYGQVSVNMAISFCTHVLSLLLFKSHTGVSEPNPINPAEK